MSKYSLADEVLGLFIMADAFCRTVKDFFFLFQCQEEKFGL